MAETMLGIGIALLSASLFIALFRRTRVPDVLLLIVVGIALGPITRTITPEDFGKVGAAMSTIALTVILFESGLTLQLDALRRAAGPTILVTIGGFVTTAAVVAGIVAAGLRLDPLLALATGAIVAGTSSAVVIPLVKQLQIGAVPSTVLAIESALTDVLCIVIAGAALRAVATGGANALSVGGGIALSFAAALLIGGVAAFVLLFLVNVVRTLPNAMVGVTAFVFITYGVAEMLGASGAIASLALGFTLANRDAFGIARLPGYSHLDEFQQPPYVMQFLGDIIFILKTFFFVFLGISIQFAGWTMFGWSIAAVGAAYGVRSLVVRWCAPEGVTPREAMLMSVMAPKGLAAAVMAGIPLQMGIANGDIVQQFVYAMVLVSIVVTSLAVPMLPIGFLGRLGARYFARLAPSPTAAPAAAEVERV